MILPNFLVVGAQKCGSTSLHDILSEHPQANMSKEKEVNFFIYENRYNKGLEYYSSFFDQPDSNHRVTGCSSPGYICTPGVHKLIHQNLGDIKIVIILRDPIKRAFSQYWHNRRDFNEYMTESEIVENYLETDYSPTRKGYFSRGIYYRDVKKYIDLFGEENVHIIILEHLIKNQTSGLHGLYDFLGIDKDKGYQKLPDVSNPNTYWNNHFYKYFLNNPSKTKYLPVRARGLFFFGKRDKFKYDLPAQPIMDKLKEFYKPWNKKLEQLISINLDVWL
jgi:hypothetical protein